MGEEENGELSGSALPFMSAEVNPPWVGTRRKTGVGNARGHAACKLTGHDGGLTRRPPLLAWEASEAINGV